jgi:nitric oxide reductase subunit B
MIARGGIQAAAIVLIFGFFILGILTYYTSNNEQPIPNVVKNTNGETLCTRGDSTAI